MADDLEQLVLSISADTRQISRAIKRLEADTGASTRKIEQQFENLGRKINGIGAEFSRSFAGALAAGFSAQAAKELLDTATRIKNGLKAAGLSGEELTSVYDQLFASAQKNGAPLESLVQLYSRVSLAQKDLGVNSTQIVGLIDTVGKAIRLSGGNAEAASGAILQLGQALGGSKIQAEEYNSMIDGLPGLLQAAAAGIKEAGGSVSKLTALVKDGEVSNRAFFEGIAAGASVIDDRLAGAEATIAASFVRLQNVLVDVAVRFEDSTHASRILANMIDNTLIPAIQELGGIFSSITTGPIADFYGWLGKTIDRVVQLSADLGAMSGLDKLGGNPYIGPGRVQERIDAAFAGTNYTTPKAARKPLEVTVSKGTPVKPISLADYPVEGDKKAKGGRKGSTRATADDRFSEDLQSIRDRTAALKVEQETLNATFFDQQRRSVALDLEREALKQVRDEARRKGDQDWQNASLSKDQVRQINEVAEAYARQADELRKAQEAQDLQRDVLKGALGDFRQAWKDGKIDAQEWGDIVMNVLDKIINKIEDDLVDAILQTNNAGGGGGGILGSIFKLFGFGGGSSFNPTPNGFAQMLGLAGGGTVRGPGGPTGDKIPAMLSDGEHVTRSAMAKKYAPLLAAINADKLPHFAEGGFATPQIMIPQMPTLATPAAPGPSLTFAPQFNVDASNAQPGVGREIEAALKKVSDNMTPMVVKALRDMKVRGVKV